VAKLLYLVHRIPFPPNKGDKIRSFHFLRELAKQHEIYLGSFVDDPDDWAHAEVLQAYCREVFLRPLQPRTAKLKSLRGLFSAQALSVPYYFDAAMRDWVLRTVAEQGIERVLIFSSPMAQYVADLPNVKWLADFVDVDSDKWRQYAENKSWPMNWIYRREARCLLSFETAMAQRADHTVFVSAAEAQLFRRLAPGVADKVGFVTNGVDSAHFDPDLSYPSPFSADQLPVVFVGAMDYWANVDAVCWFAQQVWPAAAARQAAARFYIVGSKPDKAVQRLAEQDNSIIVTGRVDDVRDYVAHAALIVAPLRIARGIQNKVLEALAMSKPIVASSMAMEGLHDTAALPVAIADDAPVFVEAVVTALAQAGQCYPQQREYVLREFDWSNSGTKLLHYLAQ
jgi:sugar transferase (PEP-CTERM/EpsH1 system associated)